jgi:hypothetical protein
VGSARLKKQSDHTRALTTLTFLPPGRKTTALFLRSPSVAITVLLFSLAGSCHLSRAPPSFVRVQAFRLLALQLRARKVEDLLKLPLLRTALRVLPLHGGLAAAAEFTCSISPWNARLVLSDDVNLSMDTLH